MNDHGFLQLCREFLATLLITFHQAYVELSCLQVAGYAQANATPTEDKSFSRASAFLFLDLQHILNRRELLLVGEDEDAVSDLDGVVTAGNDRLALT